MNRNAKLMNFQRRRIQKRIEACDPYTFFNLLTGPELFSILEDLLPVHRERIFPPTETLSMFLAQAMSADVSCQNIVNVSAVQRLSAGLPPCSTLTGSYCKARQRLPITMVAELTRYTGQLTEHMSPAHWHWKGRPVKLIDGTTVSMPDTWDNQLVYPQQRGQKPGLGFPLCRLVGVISLSNGSILDAAIGPMKGKGGDELTLLRSILDSLDEGDIVVADAYYASYFLLAELIKRGVDAVFAQNGSRKKSTDFRRGKKIGHTDHIIVYNKPRKRPDWMSQDDYQAAPEVLRVRELKVEDKILVTTLLCKNTAPKSALKQLYKSRWHVELDMRNVKITLGMETFHCKTPGMVEKEMWVYFLAYNLIRILMAQAASLADLLPRQLSFKHTLQIWLACRWECDLFDDTQRALIFKLISEHKVGNRPGRIEPRAIKRRPKPIALLMVPREVARKKIMRHGHPKKQKYGRESCKNLGVTNAYA